MIWESDAPLRGLGLCNVSVFVGCRSLAATPFIWSVGRADSDWFAVPRAALASEAGENQLRVIQVSFQAGLCCFSSGSMRSGWHDTCVGRVWPVKVVRSWLGQAALVGVCQRSQAKHLSYVAVALIRVLLNFKVARLPPHCILHFVQVCGHTSQRNVHRCAVMHWGKRRSTKRSFSYAKVSAPMLTLSWHYFCFVLALFWMRFEFILTLCWHCLNFMRTLFWIYFGFVLISFQMYFGFVLMLCWLYFWG